MGNKSQVPAKFTINCHYVNHDSIFQYYGIIIQSDGKVLSYSSSRFSHKGSEFEYRSSIAKPTGNSLSLEELKMVRKSLQYLNLPFKRDDTGKRDAGYFSIDIYINGKCRTISERGSFDLIPPPELENLIDFVYDLHLKIRKKNLLPEEWRT